MTKNMMDGLEVKKDLKAVSKLYIDAKLLIKQLEEDLDSAKRELRRLSIEEIPDALQGQTAAAFDDMKILCKDKIYASIMANTTLEKLKGDAYDEAYLRQQVAFDFVRDVAPHLLKNKFSVNVAKGDSDTEQALAAACVESKTPYTMAPNVHPSSLANWVKEKGIETFTAEQKEILNITQVTEATVTKKAKL